jgi:hypothetical protein
MPPQTRVVVLTLGLLAAVVFVAVPRLRPRPADAADLQRLGLTGRPARE